MRSADLDGDLLTGEKHCRVHLAYGSSTNRIAVERGEGAIDATRKGPGQRGIERMVRHGRNLIAQTGELGDVAGSEHVYACTENLQYLHVDWAQHHGRTSDECRNRLTPV